MIELELFERARVILRHCALMEAGDQVLIVSDGTLSPKILNAFATAAHADGARVCRVTYDPQIYIPMKHFYLFAGMSLCPSHAEPPAPVCGALQEADVIVLLSSDMTLYFSQAYKEALALGKRMISSVYITEENLLLLFPESEQEVKELDELTQSVGRVFEPGGTVRFTSPAGTDFECTFGQYGLKCSGGRIRKTSSPGVGKRFLAEFIPGGQVTRVPDDRSAQGHIVINRSIAAREYRELAEPIMLDVEKGFVRNISGGWEAYDLKRFLEELGGGEMYHVTEVGLGTNKRCFRCGVAAPAEDTHTAGSVTFALGCDVHLGGSTRAPAHIDCTTHRGNLRVGGVEVVHEGKIVVGTLAPVGACLWKREGLQI
jgi:2,5-dihydroxypyridine 5,6-dioxygenase